MITVIITKFIKGKSMNISYATLHEIKKEENSKDVNFNIRKDNFNVLDNNVQILVSNTRNSLFSSKTKKIYCCFDSNNGNNFYKGINAFFRKKNKDLFKCLTRKTLYYIRSEMIKGKNYVKSTGGYVLFFMFTDDINNKDYFVCTIFKQNSGLSIDNNLDVTNAIYVDLKKLQQAFIIDINMYSAFIRNKGKDCYSSYIQFIAQNKNCYSNYFIQSFGCSSASKPDKVTRNIIKGIYQYFISKSEELNSSEVEELAHIAKKEIINYLRRDLSNNNFNLGEIKDKIKDIILDNNISDIDDIDSFSQGLVSKLYNEDQIPYYFSIDKKELKSHISGKIEETSKRWTLNTEYGIVGVKSRENNDKDIILDPNNNTILIRNVSNTKMSRFIKNMESYNNDRENS